MRVAADASFTCVFCVNSANEKLFSSLNHSRSKDKDIDTADADVSSFIFLNCKLLLHHNQIWPVLILW